MPQEFHVVRCYNCDTFQVHIVKKSNKWSCKMCGEKQSLKKVYFQGAAKDCRINVQALNEKRIIQDQIEETIHENVFETYEKDNRKSSEVRESKWNAFLPVEEPSAQEEVESENSNYTFERPNKRKLERRNETRKNCVKKLKETILQNDDIEKEKENSTAERVCSELNNIQIEKYKKSNKNLKESKWNCFVVENENDDILDNSSSYSSLNEMHCSNKNNLKTDKDVTVSNINSKWNHDMLENENDKSTQNALSNNIFNFTDANNLDDILDL